MLYLPGMSKTEYDVIVVGSGPNGLAAAIAIQQEGLSVLLLEGKATIGGGLRSEELTLPGFTHDICSAIHPMAAGSPFLNSLPLSEHGLEFIYPPLSAAHPFDDGKAALLSRSPAETANSLGNDANKYLSLMARSERLAGDRSRSSWPFWISFTPRFLCAFWSQSDSICRRLSRIFFLQKKPKDYGPVWQGMHCNL